MQTLEELSKTLGSMPPAALNAAVLLSGFALAAFAIYAVLSVLKDRR